MDGMWKWNFLICSGEIVAMQQNPVVSEWDKRLCGGREMSCNSSRKYCENLSYHSVEYQEHAGGIDLLCPDTDGVTSAGSGAESFHLLQQMGMVFVGTEQVIVLVTCIV